MHVDRRDFLSSDEYYRAVREAGGPSPRHPFRFAGNSEAEQIMATTWGANPLESAIAFAQEERARQLSRPNCFIRKLPLRRTVNPQPFPTDGSAPTLISIDEFASHYAAAQFAAEFGLWCDTSVTIWWGQLGYTGDEAIRGAFSTFQKCLCDWLRQRDIPLAYFYAHEEGDTVGLHTHIQVHVPMTAKVGSKYRVAFRAWVKEWARRQRGEHDPRSIKVSRHNTVSHLRHWLGFHYQVKGFDPRAVVVQANNSEDRLPILLGDLIANHWRNPGFVTLKPRIGHAVNLGSKRRETGYPNGVARPLGSPIGGRWLQLDILNGGRDVASGADPAIFEYPPPPPFQSRWEAGRRDVLRLYGLDFCERVTKLSYGHEGPAW